MAVTSLFFIRHGETDYNKKGIIQGGGVDSDLNITGHKQAQSFFEFYQHLDFGAVYCSTLKRTAQTLAPWKHKGYEAIPVDAIKELGWGIHEGRIPTREEVASFQQVKQRWREGEIDLKVPEGESPREGWNRAAGFIEQVYDEHRGQRVLICSHGRQLRIMLSAMLDGDISLMEKYTQPNTGLHVLEMINPSKYRVHTLSDTRHLIA